MANLPTVLLLDSGLGGLTVFREVAKARPDARYIYLADDARFPYGDIPEAELVARIIAVMGDAIATHKPDIVIIACNTASTLALAPLREKFKVPFIGTVPAIKPACSQSMSKHVSVLGTQATVSREYTRALIREFGYGCDVKLIGATRLAAYAEAELNGAPVPDAEIAAEITPCFIDADNRRTDAVVLACTHYPLLLPRFRALAPWPVDWIDPAPAIARRLVELTGSSTGAKPGPRQIIFTSGRPPTPALAGALCKFGIES